MSDVDLQARNCPADDVLQSMIDGRLEAHEQAALHEHLSKCTDCRALLAGLAPPQTPEYIGLAPTAETPQPAQELGNADYLSSGTWTPPEHFDGYRVLRLLGRGAMGQVFLAHDTRLDRPVAIKFIVATQEGSGATDRFLTEARAIARLAHPNVVAVYRAGELDGRPYLVSEFVSGTSLNELSLPLPDQQVLDIALGLCRGLAAAHHRGVLHRDIKPANAILAYDGSAKLLDFGLAKLLDRSRPLRSRPDISLPASLPPAMQECASPALTRTGTLLGTPHYMAPEIWRSEPATRQADIYSLGILLYELCAGRTPYRAPSLKALYHAVQSGKPMPLLAATPNVDPRLGDIVDRCLRHQPSERFGSAAELVHALERLRTHEPSSAPPGNPYRGLSCFESEHRTLFFGRSQEIQAVLDLLRTEPLVVVAGDSGAGKSSLCRAGVLPLVADGALDRERAWSVRALLPGRHPLLVLADALARPNETDTNEIVRRLSRDPTEILTLLGQNTEGAGLVLFIDQAEELITQSDPVEAATLAEVLGQLYARVPGVRVLLTVRADFLARLAALPGLGTELTRALYLLRPLSPESLREAIAGPARAQGVRFESEAMVEDLTTSTAQAQGGLPLLQFALSELWEARDAVSQIITQAALGKLGGVSGALSRHADDVLASLLPAQRQAARRLLGKLVTAAGTRARLDAAELFSADPAEPIALEALVRGRLLVAREAEGRTVYEVAHEALIQGWVTLQGWLSADQERRALRERIAAAAAEWERLGRVRGVLWGEHQLREIDVLAPDAEDLQPRVAEFLSASHRQVTRRRRARGGVFAGLLCLPLVLSLFALQWRRTQEQRQRAEDARLMELGARADSLAQIPGREVPALVAAVQSVGPSLGRHQMPSGPAMEGLSAAVTAGRRSLPLRGHGGWVRAARFSPDGQRIITTSDDGTARLWDGHTGAPLVVLAGHGRAVTSAAFSTNGDRVVSASDDGTARIWDGRTGASRATLLGHGGKVLSASFSADGRQVVTASADGTARLWDGHTGEPRTTLRGHLGGVNTACFSPGDARVLTAGDDGTARLWDPVTGQQMARMQGPAGKMVDAVFSPDGTRIVTASDAAPGIRIWDARGGQLLATLAGSSGGYRNFVQVSPDGSTIAGSTSDDKVPGLWDGRTASPRARLKGHLTYVAYVVFSAEGKSLLTAGDDGTARLWDTESGQLLATLAGHTGPVLRAGFSPDGRRIVTASWDQTARLWNVDPGQQVLTLAAHSAAVLSATFSPDGRYAATAGHDNTARVWDAGTGQQMVVLPGHVKWVKSVRFSPNGRYLATTGGDQSACIWDWRAGQVLATLRGHEAWPVGAVFSPDGERVATISHLDGTARVWDWRASRTLRILAGHSRIGDERDITFSPDGLRIATTDGAVRLWDAQTGQLLLTLQDPEGGITGASFSPDGARLVTGGTRPYVRDARSGQPLVALPGHMDVTSGVSFSADGARVVTVSPDWTVRVWDAWTGRQLAVIREASRSASFSPDGQRIIVASFQDSTAKIYPATTDAIFRMACDLLRYQPEYEQVRTECAADLPGLAKGGPR